MSQGPSISNLLRIKLQEKYELERVLGSGGAATVFQAHHKELDRTVAIKIKHWGGLLDDQAGERFLNEGRLLARIDHPNVLRIYELGTLEKDIYMVCEYVSGGSLARLLLQEKVLNPGQALNVFGQLLEGMTALHEHSIIHRDLKPENILLDKDGLVKIADFGLARSPDREFSTSPGVIIGTPGYMSPEQILGEATEPATDIYSAGVILFECLAGQLPFHGTDEREAMRRRLREAAPSVQSVEPMVPSWMNDLIGRMLERRPQDRPGSARIILQEIETAGRQNLDSTQPLEIPRIGRPPATPVRSKRTDFDAEPRATVNVSHPVPPGATARVSTGASRPPPPPKVAPRRPVRPPRKWTLPTLAVCIVLALTVLAVIRRAPPSVGALHATVQGREVMLTGEIRGEGPFHLEARIPGDSTWTSSTPGAEGKEARLAAALPKEARFATRPVELRLRAGTTTLARWSVPALAMPWGRSAAGRVAFDQPEPAPGGWSLFLGAERDPKDHPVPGVSSGDTIEFDLGPGRDSEKLRLDRIRGSLILETPGCRDARSLLDMELILDRTLVPVPTLRRWLLGSTGRPGELASRGRLLKKDARIGPDPALEAFGLDPGRASPEDLAGLVEAYGHALASGRIPLPEKRRVYFWLQDLLILQAWTRDWERPPSVDPARIAQPFVHARRGPYEAIDLTPEDVPHAFLLLRDEEGSMQDLLAVQYVVQDYVEKELLLPATPDRPVSLLKLKDHSVWHHSQWVPIRPPLREPPDRVGLRLLLSNFVGHQYFRMRFPGWKEEESLVITNPEGQHTVYSPAGGRLLNPDNRFSWQNIPVGTLDYRLEFPRGFFEGKLPDRAFTVYEEVPGARHRDYKAGLILRAQWYVP